MAASDTCGGSCYLIPLLFNEMLYQSGILKPLRARGLYDTDAQAIVYDRPKFF